MTVHIAVAPWVWHAALGVLAGIVIAVVICMYLYARSWEGVNI